MTIETESLKFTITTQDLLSDKCHLNGDQHILSILKDKGAPIDGILFFTIKKGYSIVEYDEDVINSTRTYTFKRNL